VDCGKQNKLWGIQSWLQPAFSRRLWRSEILACPEKAASKAAAGKIACPTK
jgi:hypothetical protein